MTNSSVVIFSEAARMLAEADTIQKAKELKDLAITASEWAKRKGMGEKAITFAKSYALEAERKMGEMLKETERATGGDAQRTRLQHVTESPQTLAEIGISKRESSEAQKLAALPEEKFEAIKSGGKTRAAIAREVQREKNESMKTEIEAVPGLYDVIVVDPPWPVKKIEREVRPNQVAELDYPTMTIDEIKAINIPAAKDCHLLLWTTNKFLPVAFEVLEAWKFRYSSCMVWHKNGGFQPFGFPQLNSEFCLYARKGNPIFIDTKDFKVCFNGNRREHSRKPEEFYNTITRVTTGHRIDIFSREKRDGWETWGNEKMKF